MVGTVGVQGQSPTQWGSVDAISRVLIDSPPMVEHLIGILKSVWSAATSARSWWRRRGQARAVDKLAELRATAVTSLLNRPISSEAELQKWVSDKEVWRAQVIATLRATFRPAVVHSFATLGVLEGKTFPTAYTYDHNWHLNMLDKELKVLEDTIARYS